MSPTPSLKEDSEPPLIYRVTWITMACAVAAALFVLVSGVHAGGGTQDSRLLVAQCWHDIEQKQAMGADPHRLRIACQTLESGLASASGKRVTTMIASQD